VLGALAVHGVIVEHMPVAQEHGVETFTVASIDRAAQPFQGHRTVSLDGTWARSRAMVAAGTPVVYTAQQLGVVAAILLEPQSADGLVTWNRFDDALTVGAPFAIKRLLDR
jgi:hypothetical protein